MSTMMNDSFFNWNLPNNRAIISFMVPKTKPRTKRKHTRFLPDIGDYAVLLIEDKKTKKVAPHVALLVEESFKGCQVAVNSFLTFKENTSIRIKVGKLDPCTATVKWIKKLSTKVTAIGLEYED